MPRPPSYPLSPDTALPPLTRCRCTRCRRNAAVQFDGEVLCGDCFLRATLDFGALPGTPAAVHAQTGE